MTTQQQPTEPQTEQQEPTPRAEADGSLAERTAYLEGAVGDIPRQLDAQNRSLEGLRGDMDTKFAESRTEMNAKFAEQRTEMNAKFAEMRESFAEFRTDMNSRMDRQDARMARLEDKLNQLFYAAVIGFIGVIAALIGIIGALIAVAVFD